MEAKGTRGPGEGQVHAICTGVAQGMPSLSPLVELLYSFLFTSCFSPGPVAGIGPVNKAAAHPIPIPFAYD